MASFVFNSLTNRLTCVEQNYFVSSPPETLGYVDWGVSTGIQISPTFERLVNPPLCTDEFWLRPIGTSLPPLTWTPQPPTHPKTLKELQELLTGQEQPESPPQAAQAPVQPSTPTQPTRTSSRPVLPAPRGILTAWCPDDRNTLPGARPD